jgi:hypothetical protein
VAGYEGVMHHLLSGREGGFGVRVRVRFNV